MPLKLVSRIRQALRSSAVRVAPQPDMPLEPLQELYKLLTLYYLSNGMYDQVRAELHNDPTLSARIQALRNPTFRAVEFYAAKLWPGNLPDALPIVATNQRIVAPIQQVWTWSNWAARKQRAARWLALYGDLFIKVAETESLSPHGNVATPQQDWRVFFQLIKPWHLTAMTLNERGHLTTARIDIPRIITENRQRVINVWTEYWEKDRVRVWARTVTNENVTIVPLDKLGTPMRDEDHGLGFVPIVHAPFRDIGDLNDEGMNGERGMGIMTPCIEKIDEANRMASAMHTRLFRHGGPVWALESNMMDSSGRPLPAPRIQGNPGRSWDTLLGDEEPDPFLVNLGSDEVLRLPGMSKLTSLIPTLPYDAMLQILQAQLLEIERDIPELRYYRMDELGNVSGVAVRLMLSDAIDHVIEARGNAEAALIRADQMALTIAQRRELPAFAVIGTFEQGDFDHTFAPREVLPKSSSERADDVAAWTQAGLPLSSALEEAGFSPDRIKAIVKEEQREAEQAMRDQQQGGFVDARGNGNLQTDTGET